MPETYKGEVLWKSEVSAQNTFAVESAYEIWDDYCGVWWQKLLVLVGQSDLYLYKLLSSDLPVSP